MLKPADVVVLLDLVSTGATESSIQEIADRLEMSASQVHASLQRAEKSKLLRVQGQGRKSGRTRSPIRAALCEFLVHGVKYAYPPTLGSETRGVPTAASAPFFTELVPETGSPWVWPYAEGEVRGLSFSPLARVAPKTAARSDQRLYELLVYVDALRAGAARERRLAKERLVRLVKERP